MRIFVRKSCLCVYMCVQYYPVWTITKGQLIKSCNENSSLNSCFLSFRSSLLCCYKLWIINESVPVPIICIKDRINHILEFIVFEYFSFRNRFPRLRIMIGLIYLGNKGLINKQHI